MNAIYRIVRVVTVRDKHLEARKLPGTVRVYYYWTGPDVSVKDLHIFVEEVQRFGDL